MDKRGHRSQKYRFFYLSGKMLFWWKALEMTRSDFAVEKISKTLAMR